MEQELKNISSCDQTWFTCVGLHNMLLDKDRLSKNWEQNDPSNWEMVNRQFQGRRAKQVATSRLNRRLMDRTINKLPSEYVHNTQDRNKFN